MDRDKKVYPRVCGGTRKEHPLCASSSGLSPRVRGNPRCAVCGTQPGRSIPACAGEPSNRAGGMSVQGVYPRVCEGTKSSGWIWLETSGLSPRVRGNRPVEQGVGRRAGSIPACAGEPVASDKISVGAWVYPRVCGGTWCSWPPLPSSGGLSPRVRGNLWRKPNAQPESGSIPACAGEPVLAISAIVLLTVYPRVCGGTYGMGRGGASYCGLSPRVRGNQRAGGRRRPARGSIPACAGEPAVHRSCGRCSMVYPRVCGGTENLARGLNTVGGLSPRVRGNLGVSHRMPRGRGSIPACAGEPAPGLPTIILLTVYPRVCGGTRFRPAPAPALSGLSPRVRGNLEDDYIGAANTGSIPACAGEPSDARSVLVRG